MSYITAAREHASASGFVQEHPSLQSAPCGFSTAKAGQSVAVIGLLIALAGCATPGQYLDETKSVDVTSAYQLTNREAFEAIDLGDLLCLYAPGGDVKGCDPQSPPPIAPKEAEIRAHLDTALHYFHKQIQASPPSQRKAARNALQERLLSASAQRCNAYKGNLQRTFSRTNFGLGVLSTIAGTAGALVNSASAASTWAGVAAVSSGSRAEFNQDYMSNLAAYVIVDGIDKRRQTVYEQIQKRGQAASYDEYPVEAAIKDALYYHGQCGVIAGFQEASDAIKLVNDPGLNTAIGTMAKIRAANLMMHGENQTPESLLATADKLAGTAPLVAGTALTGSKGMNTGLDDFQSQIADIESTNTKLKSAIDKMTASATATGEPPDKSAKPLTNIPDKQQASCFKKIAEYSASEAIERTNAQLEKSAATREKLLAQAALQITYEQEITSVARALAEDYRSSANKYIDKWTALFEKEGTSQCFNMVANRPSLDTLLLGRLKALCDPPQNTVNKTKVKE